MLRSASSKACALMQAACHMPKSSPVLTTCCGSAATDSSHIYLHQGASMLLSFAESTEQSQQTCLRWAYCPASAVVPNRNHLTFSIGIAATCGPHTSLQLASSFLNIDSLLLKCCHTEADWYKCLLQDGLPLAADGGSTKQQVYRLQCPQHHQQHVFWQVPDLHRAASAQQQLQPSVSVKQELRSVFDLQVSY